MALDIIFLCLLGSLCGIVTGLVPGIHVNTAAPLAMQLSDRAFIGPVGAAVFICSMSITHTFIDFIPATILGIPDPDMSLAALPAHKMVLSGRGWEAVRLSGIASLFSVIGIVISLPALMYLFRVIYPVIASGTPVLLIVFSLITIAANRGKRGIFFGVLIFVLCGSFGYLVLNNEAMFRDPLMPVFSGFFGMSSLILSMMGGADIPRQDFDGIYLIGRADIAVSVLKGALSGILVSTLPGIGASQATILSNFFSKGDEECGDRKFILSCCSINTSNALFAIIVLYLFGKPRNGALICVKEILGAIRYQELILLVAVVVTASFLAYLSLMALAKAILQNIGIVRYDLVCVSGIGVLIVLIISLGGMMGICLFAMATIMGLLPPLLHVNRCTMMAFLLVPVMSYYI